MDTVMSGHGIQSLELGINILIKIAEEDKPLSITEISDLCGISKSKLHRYLTSLCRTGFLQRDSSLQYSIGSTLIRIGNNAVKSFDIKDIARPTLIKLRDLFNETVFLSIWGGNGPYPIEIEESRRQINIGIQVGNKTSIVLTTSGRLFAAFLPEEVTKDFLQKDILEHRFNPEEFRNELSDIRKKGYSVTEESLIPGIVAVGCPVFSRDNHIVATISIVGIKGVLDLSSDSQVIHLLKKECTELTQSLRSEL
ncbi:IclR family transcriptional regulator [Neobacillus sp. WH10]|uniref:IclR family transcriptional regulator n=1 Tax=Neobacillus sp. WH10 TaxID=3047873 RepID=UPI0024C1CF01|nr:IclR family transcriptional regulator [Neobacillus sp. WH10]WHY77107.1 IclR family transcriptional regulator [Neobacillus sp. WH10]